MISSSHRSWGCPFCTWTTVAAEGGFDFGLIQAHLYVSHREEADGLFPRELLRGTSRTYFTCPYFHAGGREWHVSWASDGTASSDACEENSFWAGDPDVGLLLIAQHIESMHPELIYGSIVPESVLAKLRNAGVRGSPGFRIAT